jgi:hypothetical protein
MTRERFPPVKVTFRNDSRRTDVTVKPVEASAGGAASGALGTAAIGGGHASRPSETMTSASAMVRENRPRRPTTIRISPISADDGAPTVTL